MNVGGGLVAVHAADNAFAGWPAFNEMTGVADGETETSRPVPSWYYRDGKLVPDSSAGRAGSHGRRVPFQVTVRDSSHPITKVCRRSGCTRATSCTCGCEVPEEHDRSGDGLLRSGQCRLRS